MKIWLNKIQTRRAIEFFKPINSAEIGWGDVYIETNDNEIVFMGCDYSESFSLQDTKFILDCEEELFLLTAIIKSCDCDIKYDYVKIIDQHGNILDSFTIDGYSGKERDLIREHLANVRYDELSFIWA